MVHAQAHPVKSPALAVEVGGGLRDTDLRTAFIAAMRGVPGAVAVIATGEGAARRGLAATAWSSLTADPPMMMVCVNRSASAHPFILDGGAFSINLLSANHAEVAAIFSAQRGLTGEARFVAEDWSAGASGLPVLSDAVAVFECRLIEHHEYGTHSIFVGEVTHASSAEGPALLYLGGRYGQAHPVA